MTRFLLDTGIASDYINRRHGVYDGARAEVSRGNPVGIGVPVLAELVSGIERSQSRDRNMQRLRAALPSLRLWTFEKPAAFEYGRIQADLLNRGRKIQVALDTETLPDGRVVRRDVILHPGAVAILPVIDDGHVCLLRTHRFIVEDVLWEIPAGTLEPGEAVEAAAVRELAEETGYQAGRWHKLTAFHP